jgi:hypothetical protein
MLSRGTNALTAITEHIISAVTDKGETVRIDRAQRLSFDSDLHDWRRHAVRWHGERVTISRTAWDSCVAEQPQRGRRLPAWVAALD